jgi:hypothetical protein
MKFIKPKDWVTPSENMNGIGDVSPLFAHIGTLIQAVTYPVAAAISGIGAVVTKSR